MSSSPNQFRHQTESTDTTQSTETTETVKTIKSKPAWNLRNSRYTTPAIFAVGLLLLLGGIFLSLRDRDNEPTIVTLPDYSPALTSSPEDSGTPTGQPPVTPEVTDMSETTTAPSPEAQPTPAANPSPAGKVAGAQTGDSTTARQLTKTSTTKTAPAKQADKQPAASSSASTLPEYQATASTSLSDYVPQYSSQPATPATINVTLVVSGQSYSATVPQNSTVLDVFKVLAQQGKLSYATRYYSGLGDQIVQINGQYDGNGKYWIYTINGAFAQKGASSQTVQAGDVISWTLS